MPRLLPSLVAFMLFGFITPLSFADAPPAYSRPGIFVAVGYGGRRMSSHDGIHWENVQQWAEKGADDSNNLISVAYGKGKFVAVGGGGWTRETQAGHILVSTDGATWHEVKKMPFRISPVLFENGKFVAGGPTHQLLSSDDGETWSESPKIEVPKELPGWAFWFRRGIAGNGIFVFTGNANKDQKTWWNVTTRDGKTLDSFAMDLPEVRGLAFGNGRFLLMSTDAIYLSPDGKKWEKQSTAPTDAYRAVIWNGKEFYLTAKQSTYTSADGITWKALGKSIPCNPSWSDASLYIGTGWPGKMFWSTDGLKWTQGEQPTPEMGVNQIVYGLPSEQK